MWRAGLAYDLAMCVFRCFLFKEFDMSPAAERVRMYFVDANRSSPAGSNKAHVIL